jgi:hypothetical protein
MTEARRDLEASIGLVELRLHRAAVERDWIGVLRLAERLIELDDELTRLIDDESRPNFDG